MDLIERRIALALVNEIPDMTAYAEAWNILAADFAAVGWMANAELCWSNYARYRDYERYECIRLREGCFAEIIPVAPVAPDATSLADGVTASTPGIDARQDELYLNYVKESE